MLYFFHAEVKSGLFFRRLTFLDDGPYLRFTLRRRAFYGGFACCYQVVRKRVAALECESDGHLVVRNIDSLDNAEGEDIAIFRRVLDFPQCEKYLLLCNHYSIIVISSNR